MVKNKLESWINYKTKSSRYNQTDELETSSFDKRERINDSKTSRSIIFPEIVAKSVNLDGLIRDC